MTETLPTLHDTLLAIRSQLADAYENAEYYDEFEYCLSHVLPQLSTAIEQAKALEAGQLVPYDNCSDDPWPFCGKCEQPIWKCGQYYEPCHTCEPHIIPKGN